MSTAREAIILYCISTFIHKCLHKWVCVRVALTCDVILAWRVLQSNVAHSQRAARSETHLTERVAARTGGDMVSQTNHVNPLLGQPTCMRLYRGTWRRMRCTQSHVVAMTLGKQAYHHFRNWTGSEESVWVCAQVQTTVASFVHTSFKWPSLVHRLSRLLHPLRCPRGTIAASLSTCCLIISNQKLLIYSSFVFDHATENLSCNLLPDKRWWRGISNCTLAS